MRTIPTRWKYTAIAVVAALAVTAGLTQRVLADPGAPNLSATDRIKADTPPELFSDQQIAGLSTATGDRSASADAAMAIWWAAHGTGVDDRAFLTWAQDQVPAPPTATARAAELKEVQSLKATRGPAGVSAATWLEIYGKKDIWKLYQHDQRELESPAQGRLDKKDLKLILAMTKSSADALAQRYRQSAPYVLDPSLRTDHVVKAGSVCPCSYPSRHAARAAGSRTYLAEVAPRRLGEYRWMEAQVDFSRLYMAGHVRSDITAGTFLGDLVANYVLVSRGRMPIPPSTAS